MLESVLIFVCGELINMVECSNVSRYYTPIQNESFVHAVRIKLIVTNHNSSAGVGVSDYTISVEAHLHNKNVDVLDLNDIKTDVNNFCAL